MSGIKEFFETNGFYHARGIYSPAEVQTLATDFDRIVTQISSGNENVNARWRGAEMERLDGGESVVLHTHNVQHYSAAWHRALLQENLLDVAEAIIGPDIILHHTKLFQKPPEKGAPFPMHQDWTYFPTIQNTMIAGVIHVSEATDEMGCLRVYPGSHKLGRVDGTNGQIPSDVLAQYPIENATPVEAQPGDVVFFHYFTLHGSLPNRSPKTRKTVLVQLHSGQDRVEDSSNHSNARLALRGWNLHARRGNVHD